MKTTKTKAVKSMRQPVRERAAESPALGGATLIAVVGTSPAILTETIWALAKPSGETPLVIPEEVIAITTTQGRDKITEQLLTPSVDFGGQTVWQTLRLALLGSGAVKFGFGDSLQVPMHVTASTVPAQLNAPQAAQAAIG